MEQSMNPSTSDVTFRRFRGEADYPGMSAVIMDSREADAVESMSSAEQISLQYRHLANCDPATDTLFVEAEGQLVGYSRVWWDQGLPELPDQTIGPRRFGHFANLLPAWRGEERGDIRRAMLRWNEGRAREIATRLEDVPAALTRDGRPLPQLEVFAADSESHWTLLLESEGYQVQARHVTMVRPNLDDIPDRQLPPGLEIRPVERGQLRTIWEAAREAFMDEPGQSEWAEEWYEWMLESPDFRPELWQVAWDGDQVVGTVMNEINEAENREYHRLRGYTEGICVRRRWRRQGVARALIASSLRLLEGMGFTEAALGANPDNPNGAVPLYESMGYRIVKHYTVYRKPLWTDGG